ncbi:MAG: hypothetical protein PUK70_01830 [Bacteroidales bacterium]|nr:hypothetical protein [Bacteroidales bacterium]
MTQQLLKSRLLGSAQCAPEQTQPDFDAQLEEFKAIVHSVLYSESGYIAIAQSLDEALGLLEECLASKQRTQPESLPSSGDPPSQSMHQAERSAPDLS